MFKSLIAKISALGIVAMAIGVFPSIPGTPTTLIGASEASARDNIIRRSLRYTFKHSKGVSYQRAYRARPAPRYRAPRYRAPRYRY